MRPPRSIVQSRSICQICESFYIQRRRLVAPPITIRNASQEPHSPRRIVKPFATLPNRTFSSNALYGDKRAATARGVLENGVEAKVDHGSKSSANALSLHPSSVADIMGYLRTSVSKVTTAHGIPPEKTVSSALEVCDMLATWFTDEAVQPQIAHAISEWDSAASTLLSLDGSGTETATKPTISTASKGNSASAAPKANTPLPEGIEYYAKLRRLTSKISEAAYLIVSHPPVFITPKLLEQYVKIQAKLGKPETLPRAFQLYASKPLAREGSVPLRYMEQNPNRPANAIEGEVVTTALDAAIDAKNIDAAVGIIENSYATTAFVRNKLLRYGLLPFSAFALTPAAAYILASGFSGMQQTMDNGTATTVAFAGIVTYVGFTAAIGMVAVMTANDQMRRVTWAPGMPLRKRWIREEERAALDKIACAWGFQETWRQGEEEGADWDALREYIGQKGMILDRPELMEGMN